MATAVKKSLQSHLGHFGRKHLHICIDKYKKYKKKPNVHCTITHRNRFERKIAFTNQKNKLVWRRSLISKSPVSSKSIFCNCLHLVTVQDIPRGHEVHLSVPTLHFVRDIQCHLPLATGWESGH